MSKERTERSRLVDREVITVSIPVGLFDKLEETCDRFSCNRSALIANAVRDYLAKLGVRVGEY